MPNSFSKRNGIADLSVLDPKIISEALRNRLWNATSNYIDNFGYRPSRNDVIGSLWDVFFKQDLDSLKRGYTRHSQKYYHLDQVKLEFFNLEWNRTYDFLEFLLTFDHPNRKYFFEILNSIFNDEGAQYQIVNGIISPLISEVETDAIKNALESTLPPATNHLQRAFEKFSKRPTPDYLNSIKESISALEALVKTILVTPNGTLGELVDQLSIHPALKVGIKKLYGWTSAEGGIRHSEKEGQFLIDENEARYMLVQCSALVNYVSSKYEKK